MKRKIILFTALIVSTLSAIWTFNTADVGSQTLASYPAEPENYDSFTAREKQETLWYRIRQSAHPTLPPYRAFGIPQMLALGKQQISKKGNLRSDFAPPGWYKYLHARGSIAKVKIIARSTRYTGLFQGANYGLLRLSLTFRPGKRIGPDAHVAPGLALKILRDGPYSGNISGLVSLDGQEWDYNFFKNPMSNIVPVGKKLGQKKVHEIFAKVTQYPEELLVEELSKTDERGFSIAENVYPRQIFFVPNVPAFPSDEHDVRLDFATIQPETLIYKIYAVSEAHKNYDYSKYDAAKAAEFLRGAEYIADIVTTSEFIASEFGDDGIFFRHQLRN